MSSIWLDKANGLHVLYCDKVDNVTFGLINKKFVFISIISIFNFYTLIGWKYLTTVQYIMKCPMLEVTVSRHFCPNNASNLVIVM